ncbi:MAG: Rpn family recombination-promoting nuclease/putative transposase [Oscillospiraceae bacterium]|nr:Rpn family recombination-promoting nuclease/putative transposase [Oscillospiraceae bacterium]
MPIVLYNGDDKWTAVTEYKKYTENYNIFGNNIINFEYLLFDLNRQDVEAVNSTRKLLDLIFRLDMLHISDNNLNKFPEAFMEYDRDLSTAEIAVLTNWLKYVLLKNKMSPELEKELKQVLAKKEGNVMTHSFERFVDGKYNEGITVGIQKGRQEGIQKGMEKIIEKLKQGGMSDEEINKYLQ